MVEPKQRLGNRRVYPISLMRLCWTPFWWLKGGSLLPDPLLSHSRSPQHCQPSVSKNCNFVHPVCSWLRKCTGQISYICRSPVESLRCSNIQRNPCPWMCNWMPPNKASVEVCTSWCLRLWIHSWKRAMMVYSAHASPPHICPLWCIYDHWCGFLMISCIAAV